MMEKAPLRVRIRIASVEGKLGAELEPFDRKREIRAEMLDEPGRAGHWRNEQLPKRHVPELAVEMVEGALQLEGDALVRFLAVAVLRSAKLLPADVHPAREVQLAGIGDRKQPPILG